MRVMKDKVPQNGLGVSEADQKKALARYAAVCWVSERVSEEHPVGWTLQTATAEASRKLWDGFQFSAGSIERYYYTYRKRGFNALMPMGRIDKGQCRALNPDKQEKLLAVRLKHPGMDATVLVAHLMETGELEAGTFSMSSVYRLFAAHGVDRSSLKAGSFQPDDGPQKAFETPMPNMLWMADMMYGPTIDLWGSLWNLHAQPPLYNLYGFVIHQLFGSANHLVAQHYVQIILGSIMCGMLYPILKHMIDLGRVEGIVG